MSNIFEKKVIFSILISLIVVFVYATITQIRDMPESFEHLYLKHKKQFFLDASGKRLNSTYKNTWNIIDQVEIYELPELYLKALLVAEDKSFYTHHGVDYSARINAIYQNLKAFKWIRGASTISEQVVRMLHPRPRTLWSKWIEGFEAEKLEKNITKEEVLQFYVNQVPYAANRRGIQQGALYYFNRDLVTLNEKEILALVVLIRSPKWYDPVKNKKSLDKRIATLAYKLYLEKKITTNQFKNIKDASLSISKARNSTDTSHFISFVSSQLNTFEKEKLIIHTTLNLDYQNFIQKILNNKIDALKDKNVHNGAVIVIDHQTNKVLSWVVAYAGQKNKQFNSYDSVLVARQPGSTLKPFLYAQALKKGWEATTLIDDSPLSESVGLGIHSYHNYSNNNYGLITLRQSLGNSLNIPAIKTIQFVGVETFLNSLHSFGISTLNEYPNYYGDGIALGNSEVSLYELTRAYSVFARMGKFDKINVIQNSGKDKKGRQIISEKIASLIADILSDSTARAKEFGMNSILNFPQQTAIKTGTSSDYRDAWTIGFDDKYTIGVWFGNLDYQSMNKVTGSIGPAGVLRGVFTYLNQGRDPKALYLSKDLIKKRVCIQENIDSPCQMIDDYFIHKSKQTSIKKFIQEFKIIAPSKNLILAKDPRIPDELEYYKFQVSKVKNLIKIEWYLNSILIATTKNESYDWKVKRGKYILQVKKFVGYEEVLSRKVLFNVK